MLLKKELIKQTELIAIGTFEPVALISITVFWSKLIAFAAFLNSLLKIMSGKKKREKKIVLDT